MYKDDEKRFGIRNDYYDQLKVLMKNPESGDPLHPDDILFEIVNNSDESIFMDAKENENSKDSSNKISENEEKREEETT